MCENDLSMRLRGEARCGGARGLISVPANIETHILDFSRPRLHIHLFDGALCELVVNG